MEQSIEICQKCLEEREVEKKCGFGIKHEVETMTEKGSES